MRFGIFGFGQAPYGDLRDRFRLAETLGFDSAWVNDDLLMPDAADFEPWTVLGALARDTSRIRLGTMVSAITFRHPAFLAAQVVTLDHVSGGRAEIGLGAGGPPHPYGAFGHAAWSPRERAERLAEQAAILGPLLRGEAVTEDGPHYPVRDARAPAALQRPRPPFIVAAHGDRGLMVAARHADGWNSLGGQPLAGADDPANRVLLAEAVAATGRLGERLDGFCRQIGRDPASIRRSVLAFHAEPDPLSSLAAFDEYVGRYAEIGIDEVILYWPPLAMVERRQPVSAALQASFERIAADRIAVRGEPAPTTASATGLSG